MPRRSILIRRLHRPWRQFARNDEALAISEYALLVAFIAIIVVGVLTIFGSQIGTWFGNRTGTITTV